MTYEFNTCELSAGIITWPWTDSDNFILKNLFSSEVVLQTTK